MRIPPPAAVPSSNFVDMPRSDGDTCFAMGLMLAYNQFAVTPSTDTTLRTYVTNSPITFPTGMAGGMGRNGAQKGRHFRNRRHGELPGHAPTWSPTEVTTIIRSAIT